VSNCSQSTCRLAVSYMASTDGGATWTKPTVLAGPMQLGWLPNTTSGLMVADYISTSFVNGVAFGVFAVAKTKSGTTFNEAMYTTASGLSAVELGPTFSSANDKPVPKAKSDHGPRHEQEERGPKAPPAGAKTVKRVAHK
jgi:hypothetical protein